MERISFAELIRRLYEAPDAASRLRLFRKIEVNQKSTTFESMRRMKGALRSPDPDQRAISVLALGATRFPSLIPGLISLSEMENHPVVLAAICKALGKTGSSTAVAALVNLGIRRPPLCPAVAAALRHISPTHSAYHLIDRIAPGSRSLPRILWMLDTLYERHDHADLHTAYQFDGDSRTQPEMAKQLEQLARNHLIGVLDDALVLEKDVRSRQAICRTLGKCGTGDPERVRRVLIKVIERDSEVLARTEAVRSLGFLDQIEALPALDHLIHHEKSPALLVQAAKAVYRIDSALMLPIFLRALGGDALPPEAEEVIRARLDMAGETSADYFVNLVEYGEDPFTRWNAAWYLGEVGYEPGRAVLQAAADRDEASVVRRWASAALQRLD